MKLKHRECFSQENIKNEHDTYKKGTESTWKAGTANQHITKGVGIRKITVLAVTLTQERVTTPRSRSIQFALQSH